MKDVLAQLGEISFWNVRIKPGMRLAFGILKHGVKKVPCLGLPGYPVSSMVTFEQFAMPAIIKMQGRKNLAKPVISAISESRIRNTDGHRIFARARVRKQGQQYFARLAGPRGSGNLTSMGKANGLMIVPEEVEAIKEGDEVLVQMLDWEKED